MKFFYFLFLFLPIGLWGYFSGEIRGGYFYPSSSLVRDIYGQGAEVEAEINYWPIRCLNFWLNLNFFCKEGHTLEHNKTKLHILPISFGIKGAYPLFAKTTLYVGVGPSFSIFETRDILPTLRIRSTTCHWGGVGKAGIIYSFTRCLFIDLFADYYYTKGHCTFHKQNLGGLRAGIGLGSKF